MTVPDDTTMSETMLAWTQARYGGPDDVAAQRLPVPEPGPEEVLVRVRATALNAGDVRILRGTPRIVRLAFGFRRPRIAGRGMDVAGTVMRVGSAVDHLRPGAEVVGELPGDGLAEYVLASATRLVIRPQSVTPEHAAALPIAAGTALRAIERAGVLEQAGGTAGVRILVIGASGGVGTFAVQLAADLGMQVVALCGARSAGLVRSLGATEVLDYRTTVPSELPQGTYDAVIDIVGTARLRDLKRLLAPGGAAVLVSGDGGGVLGPLPRVVGALLGSRRSRRLLPLVATPSRERLAHLLSLVEAGRIRPVIERTLPLTDARAALAHVDSGRTVGKVVVVP